MMAYMTLPWTPKLFYGILVDTFPLCGSKKSYIVLMGFVECLAASLIFFLTLIGSNSYQMTTILGTMIAFGSALIDVVVDGLMVG